MQNAVTVRLKFGYALVIITSGSKLLESTMSTVTQMTRARNSSTSKSSPSMMRSLFEPIAADYFEMVFATDASVWN